MNELTSNPFLFIHSFVGMNKYTHKEFTYDALWCIFWIYLAITFFSIFIGLFITLIYAMLTIAVYVMIRKYEYTYPKIVRAVDEVYYAYVAAKFLLLITYALVRGIWSKFRGKFTPILFKQQ
jgi:membrane protein required for beta-lactamase induction